MIKRKDKPNKRHPVHAESLLKMADKYQEQAEFFRDEQDDPHTINRAIYVMCSINRDICLAEGLRVQKIKR